VPVSAALREAAAMLAATSATARLDAEVLMAHALGISRSELLLRHMDDPVPDGFAALVERRIAHEPIAYITGTQEFYGLEFAVTPDVLIPRADSETMIEAAKAAFASHSPGRILDLGTGSGALLIVALTLWPKAEGIGIDHSLPALIVAMRNAQLHANTSQGFVGDGPIEPNPYRQDRGLARFVQRDWTEPGWAADLGQFDLILANPPYVEEDADLDPGVRDYEPAGALFAGPEGLGAYRVLVPQMPELLRPGGAAFVEIGASQAGLVSEIAAEAGLAAQLHRDLGDRPRVLQLTASR